MLYDYTIEVGLKQRLIFDLQTFFNKSGQNQNFSIKWLRTVDNIYVNLSITVYVKTFEGENFHGSSTMCIM